MHQLIPLSLKLGTVVILTWIISSTGALLSKEPMEIGTLCTIVETLIILLLAHSWHFTTKLPFTLGWFGVDLSGSWTGEIKSARSDEAGHLIDPVPVRFEISQSWLAISFIAITSEMETSDCVVCTPFYDSTSRTLSFRYFYRTSAHPLTATKNPSQALGAAHAVVRMDDPNLISIQYINEQGPGGVITLARKKITPS